MVIKAINEKAEKQLANAFGEVLLDNGVGYKAVGVYAKDGQFHAFFQTVDEKVIEMEWEAELSIGHEPEAIANEILKPYFERASK